MADSEVQPDEAGAQPIEAPASKIGRAALSRLKKELTDEELGQSGTQKLLLDSLERAEEESSALKSFRDKYYVADKDLGILREKFKTNSLAEVLSTGTIAIGAAVLVYVPDLWKHEGPTGSLALVVGVLLLAVGIAAKAIRA